MSDIPTDPTPVKESANAPPSRFALWALRVVAVVALMITSYLARLAFTGETAAGCGRNSSYGCEHVLSSRWSFWISIVGEGHAPIDVPVSFVASALWLTVVIVTLFGWIPFAPRLQRVAWLMLTMLTTAALGAAVWFVGLQALRLQHWCLYCMAAHACALVAWALVVWQRQLSSTAKLAGFVLGLGLASLVPLGQSTFPFVAENIYQVAEATEPPVVIAGVRPDGDEMPSRFVEVLGGATKIDITHLPRLGDADGKYVVCLLYDYACGHCRTLHRELLVAQREYQGELTIVLLPTPWSHLCNKHLTPESSTSPHACGLAKLALIVWYLAPERFAEYDAWLFEPSSGRTLVDARKRAVELLGEDRLALAESDERFDVLLQQHIDLYDRSPADLVPQILGRKTVLEAGVSSTGELLEALEQDFGFPRPR